MLRMSALKYRCGCVEMGDPYSQEPNNLNDLEVGESTVAIVVDSRDAPCVVCWSFEQDRLRREGRKVPPLKTHR